MSRLAIFLLVLVTFVVITQWRAAAREAAAMRDHPPTGQMLDVDGTRIHARVMGNGPDLVMLHGASGNMNEFTMGLAQDLSRRYRVILFDRPGLGWSGRPEGFDGAWNAREEPPLLQAELLQKAADQLDVRNPIVLGHSFGGIVTLAWGLSRPEDTAALVMVSGVAEPWPGELGWTYNTFGSRLGGALLVPLVTAFLPQSYVNRSIESIFTPQSAPDGYAEHIGAPLSLRRSMLRANNQQVNALRPHVVEMQKRYGTLTMPIEALHGDADTIVPLKVHAEVLMGDVPDGALTVLPGMGHMPHHAAPDEVIAAIDRAAARANLRESD